MKLKLKTDGKIQTHCPGLDELIGGGFQFGTISHFYGKDGSGKSTFAYQISLIAMYEGFEVVWVDLNGNFSFKRLFQMNHWNKRLMSNFKMLNIDSYEMLKRFYQNIDFYITKKTKLIIIDPVTYYYRLNSGVNAEFGLRRELYSHQLPILIMVALKNDLHIILVNQVRGDYVNEFSAVVEQEVNKYSKYVFRFEKHKVKNKRVIIIKKIFNKKPNIRVSCYLNKFGFYGCEKC
ncbi:MAG: hypothetical protein ACTSRG_17805 [Candidatus Helarchaeota archaeon]